MGAVMKDFLKRMFPWSYKVWVRLITSWRVARKLGIDDGCRMLLTGKQPARWELGQILQALKLAFQATGAKEAILLDVGASNGWFSNAVSSILPIKKCVSYEPLPDQWPPVPSNNSVFPCEYNKKAVGATSGSIEISLANHPGLSSILPMNDSYAYEFIDYKEIKIKEKKTVEMVSLDDEFERKFEPDIPGILKIDTQGYEMEVLKGATNILDSGCVAIVLLEVMLENKYDGQANIFEVIEFMQKYKFSVFSIFRGYQEKSGQISEFDIIFCLEKYLKPCKS